MIEENISVLCMQETHRPGSAFYHDERGFFFIFSGGPLESREYAGVGFIIAPWLTHSIMSFLQFSNRMASLKIRTSGGSISLISTYCPHNERPIEERRQFFESFANFAQARKAHGPTLIYGDFNARLHRRNPDEEDFIGPYVFGNLNASFDAESNRELLLEQCRALEYRIGNTFFNHDPQHQVTYYDLAASPMQDISYPTFAQLDFLLMPLCWSHLLLDIRSKRTLALHSHHFIVISEVEVCIPKKEHTHRPAKYDLSTLKMQLHRRVFARLFLKH